MNKDSGFIRLTPEKALIHVHNHHPHEHTYTHLEAQQNNQEHTSDWMESSQVAGSLLLSLFWEEKLLIIILKKGMQHSHYALFRKIILFEYILKEHLEMTPQNKIFHSSLKWSRIIFRWNHKTICMYKGMKTILKSRTDKNSKKTPYIHRSHEYFSESIAAHSLLQWLGFAFTLICIAFSQLFEFS